MINFKAIEKLSENEFLVIIDSLNGLIYTEETAVKDQIITEVSDNIALNGADKRFEIDSSKLIEKLKTFTEDDSKRLA